MSVADSRRHAWLGEYGPLFSAALVRHFDKPAGQDVHDAVARSTYDFFVSYRQQESEAYAARLADELLKLGYRVYHAGRLSLPTDDVLTETLRHALHQSSVLIILGSADAFGGEWVRWEMETFEEGHWGRMVPLVTSATSDWNNLLIAGLRKVHAVVLHEELEGAWEAQAPSPTTVLNLTLVREFLRVEFAYWMSCEATPREQRLDGYYDALAVDRVCCMLVNVMSLPDRRETLRRLQEFGMAAARGQRKPGLIGSWLGRIFGVLFERLRGGQG